MSSFVLSFIDLAIFALYFYFFGVRVRCPICGKAQRSLTYKQFGAILLVLNVGSLLLDIFNQEMLFSYVDIVFWVLPIYFLFHKPSFFCSRCFKEIPLREEDMLKKTFFY
ncbi:hypothetical protein [Desulfovibrio sp. JC022]|uniref:hypothetical protein n=1 Tax=Desulfovibrio sp. JC022 TaxID=2593642 RepID=UPI0013D25A8F|nr:hypothetical protein [Desulfovibrio sp. JC022]NDV24968.1 hypothetical protein [Desulfovibrio sp. JC022]